jgi:hypothetical protein
METVKNSRSAFRELRQAAGYTVVQVATLLGVPEGTVWEWNGGGRPRWRYMPGLAQLFQKDLAEAVRLFWCEIVGDRCGCCGGEKIFPDDPRAIHLYVKRTCVCERTKIFRSNQHTIACNRCKVPKAPRVTVKCVGHKPYGARRPRFSHEPNKVFEILRSRLQYYPTSDDGLNAFVNEKEGTRRCGRCSSAIRLIYAREKLGPQRSVRRFLGDAAKAFVNSSKERKEYFHKVAEFHPHEAVPKIESLSRLEKFIKACHRLSYEDESGRVVNFHPTALQKRQKKKAGKKKKAGQCIPRWKRPTPIRTVSYIKNMLAGQIRRRLLPNEVQGLCLLCEKLMLSRGGYNRKPPRVHRKCLLEYQGKRGPHAKLPEAKKRRGGQVRRKSLKMHYAWAMRCKLGEDSLAEIGHDYDDIKAPSVEDGIEGIMGHLPTDLETLPLEFRERVFLLRQAFTPEN